MSGVKGRQGMNDDLHIFLPSKGMNLPDLTAEVETITILMPGGEPRQLSAREHPVRLTEERPPVNRMEDDWGAICEVYRGSSLFYLSLQGCPLAAGDQVTLAYKNGASAAVTVLEIEQGRARTTPPTVTR